MYTTAKAQGFQINQIVSLMNQRAIKLVRHKRMHISYESKFTLEIHNNTTKNDTSTYKTNTNLGKHEIKQNRMNSIYNIVITNVHE